MEGPLLPEEAVLRGDSGPGPPAGSKTRTQSTRPAPRNEECDVPRIVRGLQVIRRSSTMDPAHRVDWERRTRRRTVRRGDLAMVLGLMYIKAPDCWMSENANREVISNGW